jgi:hypothetical protein
MKTFIFTAVLLTALSSQAHAFMFWCTTESQPNASVLQTYQSVDTGKEQTQFESKVYDSKSYLSETRLGLKAEIFLSSEGKVVGHLESALQPSEMIRQYVGWDLLVGTLNGQKIQCNRIPMGPSRRTCPRC